MDSFVANPIGADISPQLEPRQSGTEGRPQRIWDDSQLGSDFYGVSDFYGTQEIACRSARRDGGGCRGS